MFRLSHSGRRACALFLKIIFRLYDSIPDLTLFAPTFFFIIIPRSPLFNDGSLIFVNEVTAVAVMWATVDLLPPARIENRLITFLVTLNMEKRVEDSKAIAYKPVEK